MYKIMQRPKSDAFAIDMICLDDEEDPVWDEVDRLLYLCEDVPYTEVPLRRLSHDLKKTLGDFLYSPPLLTVNEKAKKVLIDAGVAAHYFPFQMNSKKNQVLPYFFVDFSIKKHFLDLENSIYVRANNLSRNINEVLKVVVDELADYGPMVRCIDSELIFVKDSLVQRFKEEGITGVEFCPINEFSGRP